MFTQYLGIKSFTKLSFSVVVGSGGGMDVGVVVVSWKSWKALWFLIPTQLLIHGQWWSYLSTQQLQIAQCLDLAVLIILHSGHKSAGLMSRSNSKKFFWSFYFITPGSLQEAFKNAKITIKVVMVL